MSLVFERVLTEGIALLSYVIGDDTSGTAAVIDPRPDVEIYLDLARKRSLSVTHVFETHIHADFMSGARELAARTGTARVYVSHEGGANYGYEHQPVRQGDTFEFGSLILKAQHTPGHTPGSVGLFIEETGAAPVLLAGDTLFADGIGRTDFPGGSFEQIRHSIRDLLFALPDATVVVPGHGPETTIGYEREHNPYVGRMARS